MLVQSNLTLMFFSKKGSLQYLQLSVLSGHSLSLWRSCSLALISSLQEGHRMILKSQFPSCPACSRKILSAFFLNVQFPYDAHGCTLNLIGTYKVRMCLMLFFHKTGQSNDKQHRQGDKKEDRFPPPPKKSLEFLQTV